MRRRIKKWKHLADSKRIRNSDADKLDDIQQHLQQLNYFTHQNTRIAGRYPDLKLRLYGTNIVLELDGAIHGFGDQVSESKQTRLRNQDYITNDIPFITINEEWCKYHGYKFEDVAHIGLFIIEQMVRAKERLKSFNGVVKP